MQLKKQTSQKTAVKMWSVLPKGCRHNFFIDFDSILTSILIPFLDIFRYCWPWNLKQIFDIDFWRDFDGKRCKKHLIWSDWRQRRGAARLSKTAKGKQFHTPSTLPKAGAADLRRLRRVPGAAPETSTGHYRPLAHTTSFRRQPFSRIFQKKLDLYKCKNARKGWLLRVGAHGR